MDFEKLESEFKANSFKNEDDIKLHFHADIVKPILQRLDPELLGSYHSEQRLKCGGRTDATFRSISFEFKRFGYFDRQSGIDEALYGRSGKDHGLYSYIVSSAELAGGESYDELCRKLGSCIGVGFDGCRFIFARFIPSRGKRDSAHTEPETSFPGRNDPDFHYETLDFVPGLKKLTLLLKQQQRLALTKQNILSVVNTKSGFVRQSILDTYRELEAGLGSDGGSAQIRTLYAEWDRVFGTLYGEDADATGFTEVSSVIRRAYGLPDDIALDSKMYLFAMQTFFNIFLKLLIYAFLSTLIDPTFSARQELSKADIDRLFEGESSSIVANFFEIHFMEWFTFASAGFEEQLVNGTLRVIDSFDLGTYVLRPEEVQDILQEVYMELIPAEMRHLMGEYFSPDWIVEHALDMAGYDGDIEKTLIDPCAGSGSFLTHAIKRVIKSRGNRLSFSDIEKLTGHIVGFDINPISVVAAKANYILTAFSACCDDLSDLQGRAVNIPVFIADSILAPVVYSEENGKTLRLMTSAGEFELPKFSSFESGGRFLSEMSLFIQKKADYSVFLAYALGRELFSGADEPVVHRLYDRLRARGEAFWPMILKNSFAPAMLGERFDFVVGNPPWISWKSMSKSYRSGTLSVWKSYGIFEKSAYDKKTTHDDFGMAVTYVAVDKYLKNGGSMVFLLPASFLKSTKGGEGFRKFEIIRGGQNVPFAVDCVHDFSRVRLFTVPTVAIKFIKGRQMTYPMNDYFVFEQSGRRSRIDSHSSWADVSHLLDVHRLHAQPVSRCDRQSAWLTLDSLSFADSVLDSSKPRFYRGRKGIEPAGAKGVYIIKLLGRCRDGIIVKNDISRQRRRDILEKGEHTGVIEDTFIYPMLGGRNIAKWRVKSNEFMLVPHTSEYKYGVPEAELAAAAPLTYRWLLFFHDELLSSRIQNGKFFDPQTQPFYRLDNIGEYTFAPFKVLWKEQTGSMSAVVVSSYPESIPGADTELLPGSRPIVVDSKVLMLGLYDELEAHYVCGIINSPELIRVIDGYAISTNRGVDVLKYVAIPRFDSGSALHVAIARQSMLLHSLAASGADIAKHEAELSDIVRALFGTAGG